MAHLYSHDGEVWHRRVVEVNAGVGVVLHAGEDFGTDWSWAVIQHLTQRVHVNVFGSQSGTYGVIGTRHTLHTVWRRQRTIMKHMKMKYYAYVKINEYISQKVQ